MTDKPLTAVRDVTASDLPFIYPTWLKGLRYGNSWFEAIDQGVYFAAYKLVIQRLLDTSTTKVVCMADDPEIILAYAVYSQDQKTLHWAFTKDAWRNFGFQRQIVPATVTSVSHLTEAGNSIRKKHRWTFNPFTQEHQ